MLPKTLSGAAAGLDQLLTQAGEYVYSQSQPGLWAAYLSNNNRNEKAILFAQVDPSERPYMLNYWANALTAKGGAGAMREALPLYQEAVRLKPDYWGGYSNIMFALGGLGDEEGGLRIGEQMMRLAGGAARTGARIILYELRPDYLGPASRARQHHRRYGIAQRDWIVGHLGRR